MIYGKELALIHHQAFNVFARDAAPAMVSLLRASSIASGLIVDLGCGSGILADALTSAGYAVLGIDLSPAMVELARQTAPQARSRWARCTMPHFLIAPPYSLLAKACRTFSRVNLA